MSDEKPFGDQGDEQQLPELPRVPEVPKIDVKLPKVGNVQEDKKLADLRQMGMAYNIPASLVAPIVVLSLFGIWLDGRFGGGSKFTAVGVILGIIVGFMNMIRLVQRLGK